MIAEIVIMIVGLLTIKHLIRPLDRNARLIFWSGLAVHIGVMITAHNIVSNENSTGLIFDDSVDAQKYFFSAKKLEKMPIGEIDVDEIRNASGSTWHVGYVFLNVFAMKISDTPMLLVRLFKIFLYIIALTLCARAWNQKYGRKAMHFGIVYLLFGWWEIYYYIFRNIRDALLVSICMIVYALLTQQFTTAIFKVEPKHKTLFRTWSPIVACILCLVFFRVYLAALLSGAILLQLSSRAKMSFFRRALVTSVIIFVLVLSLQLASIAEYGIELIKTQWSLGGIWSVATDVLRTIFAPIPWQYSQWFLIPSQIVYLILLAYAIPTFLFKIKDRQIWQIAFIISLVVFLGIGMDSSFARKRMPLVPIAVSWVVAGIARKNKLRVTSNQVERK